MTTKRPRMMVYLEDERLKASLEALAELEGRSLSNLINQIVRKFVDDAIGEGWIEKP
jgi:hypothetical protein